MNWNDDNLPSAEDWILAEAESYQEKLELANNTILIFRSWPWWKRVFRAKKLFSQYFKELYALDKEHKRKSEDISQKIARASKEIVREHKGRKNS